MRIKYKCFVGSLGVILLKESEGGENMGAFIPILLGGTLGGLLRGVMGIAKSLITKKEESINYSYFFLSLTVSIVIGVIAASLWPEGDFRIALLAGYAGADFLEGLFKLKFKQKFVDIKD